ncbi:MAG: hypothetical protein WCJ55_20055 [Chloroflexales bacterium]
MDNSLLNYLISSGIREDLDWEDVNETEQKRWQTTALYVRGGAFDLVILRLVFVSVGACLSGPMDVAQHTANSIAVLALPVGIWRGATACD